VTDTTLALTVVRAMVLVLGLATTTVAFRAYRRQGSRYLRDATLGLGIITAGVLVEGVLFRLASLDLTTVHLVESVAIGLGFLVLLSSFLR
jgi:hypothetical protein